MGVCEKHVNYLPIIIISLIGSHVVICVYTCFSRLALDDTLVRPRGRGQFEVVRENQPEEPLL